MTEEVEMLDVTCIRVHICILVDFFFVARWIEGEMKDIFEAAKGRVCIGNVQGMCVCVWHRSLFASFMYIFLILWFFFSDLMHFSFHLMRCFSIFRLSLTLSRLGVLFKYSCMICCAGKNVTYDNNIYFSIYIFV